ncbi:hypothetical protein AS9A_P10010 (plasmid) [Hoyosella subflava DQS3-9A1]|uniref:Uncharacterized protein n=1 Tax=Hoyosella subflava (strain DSM 45089 / JCM 17490 / NBRC 109087 / DQS3-9A1) TaxID=443218 RepID=F6ESA6_HOYSD|nr:hypothetical protein AS9A_P10010 [Hoyosella subflava DQS3-9A1]
MAGFECAVSDIPTSASYVIATIVAALSFCTLKSFPSRNYSVLQLLVLRS